MKITFTGDIMIEPPVLKGAKQKDGTYDFYEVFAPAQSLLSEADLLVGNFETPMAGPDAKYTQHYYSFNAPDSYADALKKAGFHLVSTVNNHVFDRGFEGLERTLDILDDRGIGHTGTWRERDARSEAWYGKVGDTTVAIIAYTVSTNFGGSGGRCQAVGEKSHMVNMLQSHTGRVFADGVNREKTRIDKLLGFLDREKAGRVKRLLGFTSSYPRADDYLDKQAMAPYIRQAQADIRAAREKADVVIFYPHTGGQFNPLPGAKSIYIVEKALQAGADAVMASHAHMVQKAELNQGRPCVYSLGNFNMDPHSSIMVNKYLPEYGLAVHLYVDGGKIEKTTFSITKAVRGKTGQICAWPVDELHKTLSEKEQALLEADVRQIYKMVNCKDLKDTVIRREYDLDNEAWIDE